MDFTCLLLVKCVYICLGGHEGSVHKGELQLPVLQLHLPRQVGQGQRQLQGVSLTDTFLLVKIGINKIIKNYFKKQHKLGHACFPYF